MSESEYDVILVGSGTCGATLARELTRQKKKVLILERGSDVPLKESFLSLASIAKEFVVGEKLKATTGMTVGGSSSLYFGVCKLPNAETFKKLGLDLSEELNEVRSELPVTELPDAFLAPQSIVVRNAAKSLGHVLKKNLMLVDLSKCRGGQYAYEAKWKAKSYIAEAVAHGAQLISKAQVRRVLVENDRAVGVEYGNGIKVYGRKIVLSAGAFVTPKLLMDCGVQNIGDRGFFCKPGFMVCGTLAGLKGKEAFLGYLDVDLGNGVSIGDGTMSASLFKLVMLANLKLRRLFSHGKTVAVGILMNDSLGGTVTKEGHYHKQLTDEELGKLEAAGQLAEQILERAGAKNIFRTKLVAGIPGGVVRIGEHLDESMQTRIRDLHVCDHTMISDVKITPTLTLICLARYLAKQLVASLDGAQPRAAPGSLISISGGYASGRG